MRVRLSVTLTYYLLKEIIPFISLTFIIFTILILAQQIGKQPELLLAATTPLSTTIKLLFYLLPSITLVTLPFALLIGILLGLNRLSADSEITAAYSSGISKFNLNTPPLLIGLLATTVSLGLSHYNNPWSVRQLRALRDQAIRETLNATIQPHRFINYFPHYLIYIQDIDRTTGHWNGVFILKKDEARPTYLLTASKGEMKITEGPAPSIEIHLLQGTSIETTDQPTNQSLSSFNDLIIKLPPPSTMLPTSQPQASPSEIPTGQLLKQSQTIATTVEYHKRFAVPFSCIALVLIATQLGSKTRRHAGRTAALSLGFAIAVAYYLVLIAGQNLSLSGLLHPAIGPWLANLICLTAAITIPYTRSYFSYRANPQALHHPAPSHPRPNSPPNYQRYSIRILNLINYILVSELTKYSLLSLLVLVLISIVFTLFDLIPAMSRNNITAQYTLTYLGYLTPQLTYYVTPFAFLVGIMATYHLLSRTNQITALLTSGQGILRLGAPLVPIIPLLMGGLFVLSERILPYTNREQDFRYHQIKGRQIEQATVAFGQKWVYGLNYTIYSYQYADRNNHLLNTYAYTLGPDHYQLREMTYAQEAVPHDSQHWHVLSGYRYSIDEHLALHAFTTPDASLTLQIPEGMEIFRHTVNEATKMNMSDLRNYLNHLTLIGASTTDLRIDLEKKKAFPFTCLTLAIIACPFVLIHTRRHTLTGIGLGIAIGLSFLAANALLEAIGRKSLLPIWMAVWGAQTLFITLGTYLFFKRKG